MWMFFELFQFGIKRENVDNEQHPDTLNYALELLFFIWIALHSHNHKLGAKIRCFLTFDSTPRSRHKMKNISIAGICQSKTIANNHMNNNLVES